ncbi:MAG: hypothetical protein OXH34_00950 [Bacteroidetes bacterium]|nr:hypothetical protein [Bacteroidota bacterium]
MRTGFATLTVLLLGYVMACSGSNTATSTEPDMRFGHRYEGVPPDGYHTVTISVPEQGHTFTYFPATFDRVFVRPELFHLEQDTVAVEILVKGSLPDACMELHAFDQERMGNIITATLQMRRGQSRVCVTARRPYRLYLVLEGGFVQGHYTLKLNDSTIPFTVRKLETRE